MNAADVEAEALARAARRATGRGTAAVVVCAQLLVFAVAYRPVHASMREWTLARERSRLGFVAMTTLDQIAKRVDAAYERDGKLCPSSSTSVPSTIDFVAKDRYFPRPEEWRADPPDAGFTCLDFSADSVWFAYSYEQYGARETGTFRIVARGFVYGKPVTYSLAGAVRDGGLVRERVIENEN